MARLVCLFAVLLASCLAVNLRGKKCRMLSLEGGGTKGAFQAGAFKAMVELLDPSELHYDVIAGASVGSVNGIAFAAAKIGEEKELSKRLSELWGTIKETDAIAPWSFSDLISGFFSRSYFFSNAPLLKYVTGKFQGWGSVVHRKYTITTVNVNTAETIRATEAVGPKNIPKYIVASAAVPGIFPNSVLDGKYYMDGGAVDNTNIRGGIERCREIVGDDDSAIIVDVMMTNPITLTTWIDMSDALTYTMYARGDEIANEYKTYYYLNDAMVSFPDIRWRYIIKPEQSLPNYPAIALSFDRETLKKTEMIGYETAKKQILTGKANLRDFIKDDGATKAALRKKIKLP
eukprot:TRINITY_DN1178_c0_g1_i7.p1 TRINITY_DN1178_c0_g1~~TRINITY_DN1178_c0_g1_i7.p1  ORF type:complete len:346 (-),score=92.48 TRINITY_DN1178_c0_g1_i7:188-1225(-)